MNFIKKYYISIILIILLTAMILNGLWQSYSMSKKIEEKYEIYTQMQLDYKLAQVFLSKIYEFKKDNDYLLEFYKEFSFFLPNDDEKIKLFSSLEQLAEDTGNERLTMSVVKESVDTEGKDIVPLAENYLRIKLNLVGSYNDLIYFMTKLENAKYFSDILSFNIEKTVITIEEGDVTQKQELLTTTMDVVFYLESEK
jgi:Tfp pilus assembly protein PilO